MSVSIDTTQFKSTLEDLLIQIDNYVAKDGIGQESSTLKKCLQNFKNKLSFRNSLSYLFSKEHLHYIHHLLQQSIQSQSTSSNDIQKHDSQLFGLYNPWENQENLELKNDANQVQQNPTVRFSGQIDLNQNILSNQLLDLKKLLVYILDMKSQQLPIASTLQQSYVCENEDCQIEEESSIQKKWAQYKKVKKSQLKNWKQSKNNSDKNYSTRQLGLFLLTVENLTQKMNKICKDILYDLIQVSDISCVNSKNTEKRSLLTQMLRESQERNAQVQKKSVAQTLNEYRIQCHKKTRSHRTILMQIQRSSQINTKKKEIIPKKMNNCAACSQCIIF